MATAPMDDSNALEDFILAFALAQGPEKKAAPIRGKTVLQKLIFHLRMGLESLPGEEVPHLFGPFDEAAQVAFDQLETSGYIEVDPESSWISLTERGEREAKGVWRNMPAEVRRLVQELKDALGDLTSQEVLAITYAKYPDSAKDSIVRDEIRERGPSIALRLIRRNKVSPELGAKIAGMPLREFLRFLSRNKVPVVEDGPIGSLQ